MLAAGLYDKNQTIMEAPSWVTLEEIDAYPLGHGVLDLREGVLRRTTTDPCSPEAARFACLARLGTAVQVVELVGGGDDAATDPRGLESRPGPCSPWQEVSPAHFAIRDVGGDWAMMTPITCPNCSGWLLSIGLVLIDLCLLATACEGSERLIVRMLKSSLEPSRREPCPKTRTGTCSGIPGAPTAG